MTTYYGSELANSSDPDVPRDDDVIVFPVSFAQQRLWFLEQLTPDTPAYNIPLAVRLSGHLNLPALEQTLTEIIRRHETLRTSFTVIDSQPVQVISDPWPGALPLTDLSHLEHAEREQAVHRLAAAESATPFDLTVAPLWRGRLLRLSDEEHVLLLTMHHIISDGWSMGVLVKEVVALYAAFSKARPSPLEDLSVQYADYTVWQRERLSGAVLDEQLQYWRAQLAGAPPVLELPADHVRPAVQNYRGAAVKVEIHAAVTSGLRELSQQHGATVFMTLLAAFGVMLGRWSGQADIVVGTPIAGRTRAEVEGLIGLFVNTLALRTDLSGNPSFSELLRRTREVCLGAFAHQELPFEKLVEEIEPERMLSHAPLFQVMLILQNAPREELNLPDLRLSLVGSETSTVKFDLTLTLTETEKGLLGPLEFNTDLFERATVERMAGHLKVLLEGIVANPDQAIGDLPLLTEPERRQLLNEWNDTSQEYPSACIHELFAAQAERTPDAIAVVFEAERLSYRELNARANQLAHCLRGLGVGPESVVGVMLERSAELVISLLAVLKAGGAYLPLDPEYPAERLSLMLEDAAGAVLLTTTSLLDRAGQERVRVLCVDAEWRKIAAHSAENPGSEVSAENLVYVIYTSGSTGTPKGAMNTHGAVSNRLLWMQARYGLGGADVVLQKTPFSFDVSVWELFWPLISGARLVVARPGGHREPHYLREIINGAGVTTLHFVPSMLAAFLEELEELEEGPQCGSVRRVICSGEALTVELQERFFNHFAAAELLNLYGPAEAAIEVTYWECERESKRESVPIGRPIANVRIYILDELMRVVPVGVSGELYIGGVAVGRGYLGRAELTAERYVPDAYSGERGARLYRTGDVCRWGGDGEIEYLGRNDEQVKIRGHRIELGEVEAVLSAHTGVRECVVVARAEASGDKRLVAYLSGREEHLPTISELRSHLKQQLPEYLVPAAFVFLEQLPLTASGKVDRRALPEPDAMRPELGDSYVSPRSETEMLLVNIWANVLQVDRVGINDNFFELGGDSILSLQVIARAREAGLHVTPRLIFQHQNVADLAMVVAATEPSASLVAEQGLVTGMLPLTPIQHWFFEQELAASHHFNQSLLLRVERGAEPSLLAEAISQLVFHHDALRLRFSLLSLRPGDRLAACRTKNRDEAGWTQEHAPPTENVPWIYVDLALSPEDEQATLIEKTAAELQQSLRLDEAPLLRAAFFDLGPDRAGRLLIVIHHLVVDAVSWRILLEDLQTAYQQLKRGAAVKLPAKTTSYKQWAERLAEHAASDSLSGEAAWWLDERRRLIRPLPLDYPEGDNNVASARSVRMTLTEPETRSLLQEVPAAYHTQINDVLLGAMTQAIHAWTGETRVLVDMEGHGREDLGDGTDVSRTVGWFTSLFPILLEAGQDFGPGDVLKACKEELRAIPQRGLGYGLLRYLAGGEIGERLRELPPAQISFNYLGQLDQALEPSGMLAAAKESIGRVRSPLGKRSHLLELSGNISEGQLHVWWHYSENLHSRATIERVAASFIELLRSIISHCQSADAGGYTPSDFPLAKLTQQKLDRLAAVIPRIESIYPLSPMQQGMLFHSLYSEQPGVYSNQLTCSLEGELDASVLEHAWQEVVKRHAILRTSFHWPDMENPLQVVQQRVELPIRQHDWQELSPPEQQRRFELFLDEEHNRGFDLSTPPLMRLALIRLAEDSYYFVWSHHHLLLDGWSIPLLLKEVFAFYAAFGRKQDLKLKGLRPYRDYIAWLQQQDTTKAEAFWRSSLKGLTAPTTLDLGRGRDDSQPGEPEFRRQACHLPATATRRLLSFARKHQLTLNTLLQGAWALLLSKYTGAPDVVFGATTSGRPPDLPDSASMVGLFINTLPVRVQTPAEERLLPWLKNLQVQQSEARQYEYSSLIDVQKWSDIPRGQPLFESILVLENYPIDTALQAQEMNLNLEMRDIESIGQANYPLNLVTVPGEQLLLRAGYDGRRFSDATIRRMLGHFQVLLENLVTNPDQRLSELSLVSVAERQQLLVEWNDTSQDLPENVSIQQLFEAQVERTPDAIAVACNGASLTYRELNCRANQLGHSLRAMGIGPESLVGVLLERSAEMVISLLAVLKASAAYLPLDPEYPPERLSFMLRDAQVSVLLTQARFREALSAHEAQIVCVDADAFAAESSENPESMVSAGNLAYVIYTSGSTGTPKAAMNTHGAVSNRLLWMQRRYSLGADDVVLQKTPFSFDVSVWEFFWPLITGARLVVARPGGHRDPRYLREVIEQAGVTTLHFVPSMLSAFLQEAETQVKQTCRSVRRVICSGEALSTELQERFFSRMAEAELHNLYGPTEAAIDVTFWACERGSRKAHVPIGQPIANTRIYILDEEMRIVPVGVSGELYIGGVAVGRGYLGRAELTAERYVPDAYSGENGARLYRTGDVCRWEADGQIEYLGRTDQQVKVRGHRIELGEVEAALRGCLGVRECVVVAAREEGMSERLIAYVAVREAEPEVSISVWREQLQRELPEYMIPAVFVKLEELPLTPSGKVNRRALPAPDRERPELGREYVGPRNELEKWLVGMWERVLGVENVGVEDNFFELGGDSIRGAVLVNKLQEKLNEYVYVVGLFDAPTVAQFAAYLNTHYADAVARVFTTEQIKVASPHLSSGDEEVENNRSSLAARTLSRIDHAERGLPLPLSFAQQRLWFLDQLEFESSTYNIPLVLRLSGSLDVTTMEHALNEVVRRHESLRTSFAVIGDQPVQLIHDSLPLGLRVLDLTHLPEADRRQRSLELAKEEASRPFDLTRAPLLRVQLLKLDSSEHLCLLTMHHIISDGWSLGVIIKEVSTLYEAYLNRRESPLPELPIQYADYAVWQKEWLQGEVLEEQLSYWNEKLKGAPAVLDLPVDRPRPHLQSYRGAEHSFAISAELLQGLKLLSQQHGTTLFMTLLAAFQSLLSRYSSQQDIVVGTPIAGRTRAELEGLIGFFVNTLALRTDLRGNPSFRELLSRVREVCLGAYAHQELPFEKLVEELETERTMSHAPVFQVMLVLQNAPREELELPGLTLSLVGSETVTVKFDLTLMLTETERGLLGALEFNSDLFERSTIERMAGHLQALLESIVENPEQPVAELPLLNTAERAQLISEWNDVRPEYPSQCIHELFAAQVERTPDATALIFEAERLSYRQLNERANQLAHYLQALGVGPESLVGVMIERSPEMVVSLLAVLKAGGAYLPLDPEYPRERLSFMLEDAEVGVLVTTENLRERVSEESVQIVCLESERVSIAGCNVENPRSEVRPENLAYVIYTSGSTGRPKGVMVSHGNVARLFSATDEWFEFNSEDVWTLFHSYAFDFSVWELWGALLYGGRLVVVPYLVSRAPESFYELMVREGVTVLNQTPSAFRQLMRAEAEAGESRAGVLRLVIFGGEALEVKSLQGWFERYGEQRPRLVNMYGITETTVHVTYRPLVAADAGGGSAVGVRIPDLELYVLDERMQLVPVGVAGEVYVGGGGVARGYLNRAELTAERFVPHPFSREGGARLYRTGDLARYLRDGDLEYLGRRDDQVKVRGFRIELGEVEAALSAHAAVRQAVVVARSDQAGAQRLVGYIEARNSAVSTTELRRHLKEHLPEYMIPQAFVVVERMPLTPSGKVDRGALPAVDGERPELERGYVGARSELEAWLVRMWERVVGVEGVGMLDNFFELGGDSIRGAVLINKLQEEFNENVRVVALFEAPTVAELAAYLNANFPEDVFRVCGTAPEHSVGLATDRAPSEQFDGMSAERISEIRNLIMPLPLAAPLSGIPRNPPAVFVLSPPRSGSTLLRVMLGGHPDLFAPPELELLSFHTLAERRAALSGRHSFWLEGTLRAVMQVKGCTAAEAKALMREYEERQMSTREFYGRLQEWISGRRLVDKTPSYALDEQVLQSAEVNFENALYIHLVRHPQAMIRSFVEAHLEQVFFRYEHELEPPELAEALWVISHENIGKFLARVPEERQHTVRFEELVRSPEPVIRKMCDFLGIEPVSAMLEPYKERDQRMTDGIHPLSKMLGDVKFHEHQGIEPEVADRWKQDGQTRLSDLTWRLAASLGYPRETQRETRREARPQLAPSSRKKSAPYHFAAIQPRGVKAPLFCVHAVGGHVFSYVGLSRCLGENQPFYGIQSPSLFDQREPFTTIPEMATYYVENLLAFQPHGPYLLAGHSSGGQVAFEMAQTLLKRGQNVALLALFDTDAVSSGVEQSREEIENQDDAMLLARMLRDNLPFSPERLQQLNSEERLLYIIELAKQHKLIPPDFQLAQASRFLRTLRANLEASAGYVPEKYAGRVTLFRAREHVVPAIPHGETLGWGSVAEGAVELHIVPGNHITMIEQPNVQVVAELLKTCLEKVRRGE